LRRILKIKWTDRIMKDEVFQRLKEERLLLKILKNRRHSWIGNIIGRELVINILEEAISGGGGGAWGKPCPKILKPSPQKTSS